MLPLHRYIDSSWGSEYAWAINIARSVALQGISYTAVVGEVDKQTRASIEDTGNDLIEMRVGRERDLRSDFLFYSKLLYTGMRLAAKSRPRIIHHVFPLGYKVGFNPMILCSNSDSPSVVGPLTLPGLDTADEPELLRYLGVSRRRSDPPPYPRSILSALYRQTLLKCSYILFDSETTRSLILRLEPRILTKPYGILPTGGVEIPDGYTKRKLPIEGRRMLTVGTLSYLRRKKHLDTLIRSIVLLRNRAVRTFIAGDGPLLPELIELVREGGVEDRVRFLGRLPRVQIPEYLSHIDILCSLDKIPHETMPSVQEAMMCSTPIIASTEKPLLQPQELPYGFIVNAESPEQIAYAIGRFADDPDLVLEKRVNAREFAVANFSLRAVGTKIREAYTMCLDHS